MRRRLIVVPATIVLLLGTAVPAMAAITTYHPAGGTWTVGVENTTWIQKHVMSHYHNPTKYHSATAQIGDYAKRVYGEAGYWANSDVYSGKFLSTAAYWANY